MDWADLPGFDDHALAPALNAWIESCQRPHPAFVALCPQLRLLLLASAAEQRAWLMQHFLPYRVLAPNGSAPEGLLTGYYEPLLVARRVPDARFFVPLYRVPPGFSTPWFTRQEIDTSPKAQTALRGSEIAYLSDPLDALTLHIQGSGRLRLQEADGRERLVRLSFAASNGQPYRSVGTWLAQQGATQDLSWQGIKAWAARQPQRLNELLWSNPRYIFFSETVLSDADRHSGPTGAQGVPLSAGRSIAVDRAAIALGTPVWLATEGPQLKVTQLVLAQDTGAAIVGAVRADYFVGTGAAAGELAGRLKQPLRLWVLWPKAAAQGP